MNIQRRVEKDKKRNMDRRSQRAMAKDRSLVQSLETTVEGRDENDYDASTLAEQYEVWRRKHYLVDKEEEELSSGDGKRTEIHTPD